MKRFLTATVALVIALGVLAGCTTKKPQDVYTQPGNQTPAAPKSVGTLKIGQLPIVDGLPFWIAEEKGYYKQQGLNVELITFKSANERDAAVMAGEIDGTLTDPMSVATLLNSGTKVKIASVALGVTKDEGPFGFVVAPNSGITSLEQLKGVEIAVSFNSIIHYVTEKVLLDAGFKPEEIKLTNIPAIPVRLETLMAGKVKAAVLPDPLFSLADKQGAKLIFNDKNAKQNYTMSVISFSDKALTEKADAVKMFFVAYNQGVIELQKNPQSYRELLVKKAGLPEPIKDTYVVSPFSPAQAPKKEELEMVLQWLLDKKLLKSAMTYEQLVNTTALPK